MGSTIVFGILATIAIGSAIGMLVSKNAVHSALFIVLNFATIGVFYIILSAPFIAMVQITVYAGAIVVLFLFVIMLLGAEELKGISDDGSDNIGTWQRPFAAIMGVALAIVFVSQVAIGNPDAAASLPAIDGSPEALGIPLFQNYVFPFLVTSILLLVAMMSLVVFAPRKREQQS